jgi:hypothetical protein
MIASQKVSFFGALFAFGAFSLDPMDFGVLDFAAFFFPFNFEESSVSTISPVSYIIIAALAFLARNFFAGFFVAFPLISLFTLSQ